MKKLKITLVLSMLILTISCSTEPFSKEYPKELNVLLDNSAGLQRSDETVMLNISDITAKHPDFNPMAFIVLDGTIELASQVNDLNEDHQADELIFICDLAAGQKKICKIRYASEGVATREYQKRTQAELSVKVGGKFVNRKYEGGIFQNVDFLRVPAEHTDHSNYIRYEGPGWESDKVGYRFYLDWRNATDIFGKKTAEMVLQNVGQDGFDSYHEMSDWGMDILKVGDALGIGSWGMFMDTKAQRVAVTDSVVCSILANGTIQSKIKTDYYGWNVGGKLYNLISQLTINAGSRLTRNDININADPDNLCTGIVKHDSAAVYQSGGKESEWQYFSTWGRQSLANDYLGMAIVFRKTDLIRITEDPHSHVLLLKPDQGKLTYYFLAAWEQEPGGIKTNDQFIAYLDGTLARLNAPVDLVIH